MFGFLQKLMNKKMTTEEIASLLKTNPELIKKFEESYNKNVLIPKNESNNLFNHNSKDASLDRAEEHKEPETKVCPYCLTEIKYHATRCPHCTSELGETVEK